MKKIKSILATLALLLSTLVSTKVFADTYTLTLNGTTIGHTYEVYQIFKGDLSDSTLSNIQWGTGVSQAGQTALGSAREKAETLNGAADDSEQAKKFAQDISQYLQNPSKRVTSTAGTTTIGNLEAGYYLVKDQEATQENKDSSYTRFILKVVKNTQADIKAGKPTVIKKVQDKNETTGETTDWQDSADYAINDKVPFQLTGTLPSDFDSYKEYYYEFIDTLSAGLTYNKDAKVYLVNGSDRKDITSSFTIDSNGTSYKIANLKTISGVKSSSKIVVEYTATLNTNAVIGSVGNPNEVALKYSNNPNYTGDGEKSPKGTTPKDRVIVFTYKVVVNKQDQNKAPLTGAEFTLYKKLKDGTQKAITAIKDSNGTLFTFKGLDDGDCVLKETKTPAGYNTIADIEFTVTADHDVESDNPVLKSLSGNKKTGEITFTANKDDGSLTTNVVNKKGSILPSTGGMGTIFIYVVGIALILGATILLVVKKYKAE